MNVQDRLQFDECSQLLYLYHHIQQRLGFVIKTVFIKEWQHAACDLSTTEYVFLLMMSGVSVVI